MKIACLFREIAKARKFSVNSCMHIVEFTSGIGSDPRGDAIIINGLQILLIKK